MLRLLSQQQVLSFYLDNGEAVNQGVDIWAANANHQYDYTCFGVFSTDYSHVRVTDALTFDQRGPTMLEAMMCWIHSAMGVPGLVEPPMVSTMTPDRLIRESVYTLEYANTLPVQKAVKAILDAV